MSYDPKATSNRDWAKIHLNMSFVVLVSLAVLLLARLGAIEDGYGAISVTFTVLSLMVMFLSRKADEYTLSLWSAAANAGFMAAVCWTLFAPFLEGFFDGLLARERGMEWPSDVGIYFAITVFLIAFNWKRLRGSA